MGASIPLSADFEIKVTETAQLEWNRTVNATFAREGESVDDSVEDTYQDLGKQRAGRL